MVVTLHILEFLSATMGVRKLFPNVKSPELKLRGGGELVFRLRAPNSDL